MVIVIIGILVSVLIPRYANTRDRAYVAAMKSDLRNLATSQESYYYDYQTYSSTVSLLPAYNPTAGVTVTINSASVGGWSATATSINTVKQCYLFVGNAAPIGAATQEGQSACN
jgi:type II secretory pathway pseudopilin PulG